LKDLYKSAKKYIGTLYIAKYSMLLGNDKEALKLYQEVAISLKGDKDEY